MEARNTVLYFINSWMLASGAGSVAIRTEYVQGFSMWASCRSNMETWGPYLPTPAAAPPAGTWSSPTVARGMGWPQARGRWVAILFVHLVQEVPTNIYICMVYICIHTYIYYNICRDRYRNIHLELIRTYYHTLHTSHINTPPLTSLYLFFVVLNESQLSQIAHNLPCEEWTHVRYLQQIQRCIFHWCRIR